MVSGRKPSGGCHACRARKTRCDKVPEGCTQCKKAKRVCPGYRVEGELVFRDESTNVVRKFKAKEAKKKASFLKEETIDLDKSDNSSSSSSDSPSDIFSDTASETSSGTLEIVRQDDSPLAVTYALAPTLEDRAMGIFIYNYVIGVNGPTKGHLDNLNDIAASQGLGDSLMSSIKAVGLAAYSHTARAPSLLHNARFQYMKAIQLLNSTLRNPEESIKDSTLMTIQVLGIYETVTGAKVSCFKDWMAHIDGAATIIKLRGKDQLRSILGRKMLIQITSNLLINCLHRSARLPKHMREYMTVIMGMWENPDPAFRTQMCMMEFSELRADMHEGLVHEPHEILSRALELDGKLLTISLNLPPGWEYETVFTDSDSDAVFNGRYHVYVDHWIALMWNSLRCLRIQLNQLIRGVLLKGFSSTPPLFTDHSYTAQFQLATETMLSAQADILSSVPQHIGMSRTGRYAPSNPPFQSWPQSDLPPIPMTGGSFLMWPLWFVGVNEASTEEIREFVVKNLMWIGDVLGIRQAHVMAGLVKKNSDIPVWEQAPKPKVKSLPWEG